MYMKMYRLPLLPVGTCVTIIIWFTVEQAERAQPAIGLPVIHVAYYSITSTECSLTAQSGLSQHNDIIDVECLHD